MSEHDLVKGGKIRRKTESRSARAGLTFPVGRVHRHLRKGRYASRISAAAPVFLAGVLEYLVTELLQLSGFSTYLSTGRSSSNPRKRITPHLLQLAVLDDDEISKIFQGVTISQGGVNHPQKIPALLLPKRKKGKRSAAGKKAGKTS
ncbi:histone H2A-beta, sperm-like [Lytechinus variegatus]|uniref:histone H2A-beta, sperm-like n=1 Tax=Lytechinus variegatus TaxID=7654 RepID=UPI001BB1454A|nr:histone H2A-beta, sperm-like [Lytechinus variegatus]